jgi:hypothetical protein
MNKKQCINDTKYQYTGKEKSPLGRGFSASAEKVGTIMKGQDDTNWMVIIKNRVQVWSRVPTEMLQKEEPILKEESESESEKEDILPKPVVKKPVVNEEKPVKKVKK